MATRARPGAVEAAAFLEKLNGPLTLGKTIASLRECEELTLAEMGRKLGVTRMFLCDLEHGRRTVSPERAAHFARALGHSEALFVQLALQDMLTAAGINMDVEVTAKRRRRSL